MSDPKYKNVGTPLTRVVEECSKVIQTACKIDRFGWFNYHPDTGVLNIEKLKQEMDDIIEAFGTLEKHMRELSYKHYQEQNEVGE